MRKIYLQQLGFTLFSSLAFLTLFSSCQREDSRIYDKPETGYPIYVSTRAQDDVKADAPTYNLPNQDVIHKEDALGSWYFVMAQEESHQLFQTHLSNSNPIEEKIDIRDHSSVQNYRLFLFGNSENRPKYDLATKTINGTFNFKPTEMFSDKVPNSTNTSTPPRIYTDALFGVPQTGVVPPFLMALKSKLVSGSSNPVGQPTTGATNDSRGFYRVVFKKESNDQFGLYREMTNEGVYDRSLDHFELVRLPNKVELAYVAIADHTKFENDILIGEDYPGSDPENPEEADRWGAYLDFYLFGVEPYMIDSLEFRIDSIYFEDIPKYYNLDKDHAHPLYEEGGKYLSYPSSRDHIWDRYSVLFGDMIHTTKEDVVPGAVTRAIGPPRRPPIPVKYFVSKIPAREVNGISMTEGIFYLPPLTNDPSTVTNPLLIKPKLVIVMGKYYQGEKINDRKVSIDLLREKDLKRYYNRHFKIGVIFDKPWYEPRLEYRTEAFRNVETSMLYSFGDFNMKLLFKKKDSSSYQDGEGKKFHLDSRTEYSITPSLGNESVSFEKIEGLKVKSSGADAPLSYDKHNNIRLVPGSGVTSISFYYKGNTTTIPDISIDKDGLKIK